MSKLYILVTGLTFATLDQVFHAGETYTEEQVAKVKDRTNEDGVPYFSEVDSEEGEVKATPNTRRTIAVGRAGQRAAKPAKEVVPAQQEVDQSNGDDSQAGGDDQVVTV